MPISPSRPIKAEVIEASVQFRTAPLPRSRQRRRQHESEFNIHDPHENSRRSPVIVVANASTMTLKQSVLHEFLT